MSSQYSVLEVMGMNRGDQGDEWIDEVVEELGLRDEELKKRIKDKIREKLAEAREEGDAAEVREILAAVTPFIDNIFNALRTGLKDVLDFIQHSYDGKKIGEDVAQLYQALKSQGLPDEMIREMVKQYYDKRLAALPAWGDILGRLMQLVTQSTAKWTQTRETSGEQDKQENTQ